MAAAGASQEDIEEMMAMIMSAGSGGISEDFLMAIKEAMSSGGKVFFNLLMCKSVEESVQLCKKSQTIYLV